MTMDKHEFFQEITLRISSSLDIEEALTSASDYLREFMPVDTMGLLYFDAKDISIFPVATVSREGAACLWGLSATRNSVGDEFWALIRERESQRAPVEIYNRPGEIPAPVIRCFPSLATCSIIGLALNIKGQPVGGLVIAAEGHDRYTQEHALLLGAVRDPIALAMSNARRYSELERLKDLLAEDNRALSADIKRMSGTEIIGADFGLREVIEMVRRVAPLTSPVLLLGETGTGKEVIANAIHMSSPRSEGPLIRMQCGAIPEALLDSELFGHEKGAFTGASDSRRGRFERADGGTLFLDEIGELSAEAQVKLLRVLQEQQFERVGGTKVLTVNVRVIAATHRDLGQMVSDGLFREDLWYRLNVFPIHVPPLRLRRSDMPSLVQYFVESKAKEMNLERTPGVTPETLRRLQAYTWPGNVRELQNVIERALILTRGDWLVIPALGEESGGAPSPSYASKTTRAKTMDAMIADHIRITLEQTGGKISGLGGAAEQLDMHPNTLRFRMKKLGIELSRAQRSVR